MLYAIGKPNEPVRQFVQVATVAEAALQCQTGETYVLTTVAAPSTIVNGATVVIEMTDAQIVEEKWLVVKQQRNLLLDQWRWTIALDSPLSIENQQEWLAYCKALNRVTIDYLTPDDVVWPTPPSLMYPETASGSDATTPDAPTPTPEPTP